MAKRILVVEDDSFLRDLYVEVLKSEGYDTEFAVDGEDGLTKITAGGYDLVLLDIMLPKMDGLTILKKIKEAPPTNPNKAVAVLSNLGQDSAISEAIANGAVGYMIKSDYTPDQALKQFKTFMGEA
jgi:CheY-like chemotaxis protein